MRDTPSNGSPDAVPVSSDVDEAKGQRLSEILRQIADDQSRERISVADLLLAMEQRAIGALMFIFAVPIALPMPPGTSTVLGAPLIFLAAQMALGLRPWLPKVISNRSLARTEFAAVVDRAGPWLAKAERLLRPRLMVLTRPPIEYAVGALCFLLAVVLLLPIPLGNMPPALAICMFSLGILEDDGAWVLAGLALTIGALALIWGVLYAMIASALFIISNAFA